MIWLLFFAAASVWFLSWCLKLLYVAWAHGYVMALTNPFQDTVEEPQSRSENPSKFWANVAITLLLLPLALGGVWMSLGALWAELHQ